MIEGTVNENYEATIQLTLRVVAGDDREIETIIDTGYTGHLILPTMLIDRVGFVLERSCPRITGRRQSACVRRLRRNHIVEWA